MSLPILEVANANFVTAFLAVGGDLEYDNRIALNQAAEIVDAGITHVLDVRQECDDAALWSCFPEVSYLWEGIDDAGQKVPGSWFESVTAWATKAIAEGGVVLTHCHMGINRGPSAGYAVLLAQGWDPVDALAAIRRARPIAAVAYAEDALDWHLTRTGVPTAERQAVVDRVNRWRKDNPLDVVRIIRAIRRTEHPSPQEWTLA